MRKKGLLLGLILTLAISVLAGCGKDDNTLKVAATSVPHAEILEFIKEDLSKEGIDLEIVVVEDYNIPNRALADKEVDANFFQHFPYLEAQIADFGYEINALTKVHIEPMGLYSKNFSSLEDIPKGATIAVPNDPSNEARALALLHNNGVISLDDPANSRATVLNIVDNPKNITFEEVDAALLPRTLDDVDGAVINTNFALQADLVPIEDAIIIEGEESPYVNILTIRNGEDDREDLQALSDALTSESVKEFILEKYEGAVVPVN
ncbi:MetQ/NlpA family ABC transporter substrate-binding protein [Vallitalea okinawensis]|uniref:MetQ/NlpA family ABC transporter substrate-binding protein n=1 Tax=Vallitalea okinawensis TaxID=2078660 RepID=UPI000CFCB7CD|nr:MetQ/NlpA family ABC transporter substrate-binding protein [Vallitalea okinawensis]